MAALLAFDGSPDFCSVSKWKRQCGKCRVSVHAAWQGTCVYMSTLFHCEDTKSACFSGHTCSLNSKGDREFSPQFHRTTWTSVRSSQGSICPAGHQVAQLPAPCPSNPLGYSPLQVRISNATTSRYWGQSAGKGPFVSAKNAVKPCMQFWWQHSTL
jgi:hypothetical protein